MIWAAANEVTERQVIICVTKRFNAQRYARTSVTKQGQPHEAYAH